MAVNPMEEEGLPKKNIVAAIALAFGVYLIWAYFLPKPSHQKTPTANSYPTAVASNASSASAETVPAKTAAETPFQANGISGKLRLDDRCPITQLENRKVQGDNGEEALLLAGSDFLASQPLNGPQGMEWKVSATYSDGFALEAPFASGTLRKEIRFNGSNGFGLLRLELFSSAAGGRQGILLSLSGNLPYSDRRTLRSFVGYEGKKGLIIENLKKKQEVVPKELVAGKPLAAVGVSSRYHMLLFYDLDKKSSQSNEITKNPNANGWLVRVDLAPGEVVEFPFYAGLKGKESLKQLGLDNLLFGGLLGPLKRLIHNALNFLYKITGNYGFSIILLTIIFQIILLPLTWKNVQLSRKMKALQPKLKFLQEKYKNDPTKLNAEMLTLYRAEGANPLGGCLLLLPQMPIFIALYSALNENYALFRAPFILWIKNLADYDPTYILPIVMGGAMFLQTKINAATVADSSQKMMSYMMPVMFTWMFLKFPAGLVLYWLTSNILSIGIMFILPKLLEKGV